MSGKTALPHNLRSQAPEDQMIQMVQENFDKLALRDGELEPSATPGTAFPSNPSEGQHFSYIADDTNGVIWRFEYHATGSSYDWWFVGGPPLMVVVATAEGTTSATYVALATTGPVVTVPLAGDWNVHLSATQEASSATNVFMSYDIGGTGAADVDAICAGTATRTSPSRVKRKTGLSAATALTAKYRSDGANTGTFRERTIAITPIRTSG